MLLVLQLRHGKRHLRGGDRTAEEHRSQSDRGGQRSVQLHGPGRDADPGHLHGRREWLPGERRPPADAAANPGGDTTRLGAQRGSPRRGGALQKILESPVSRIALRFDISTWNDVA